MSENIYAQIDENNIVIYTVDMEETYGKDWQIAKETFEKSGLKYVKVENLESCHFGDVYDEENKIIICKPDVPQAISTFSVDEVVSENEKKILAEKEGTVVSEMKGIQTNENNHSFLALTTVSNGNVMMNYGVPLESKVSSYFTSINPQFLSDGSFICNALGKRDFKIFFNKIYHISKDRKIIKELDVPNLHHECIFGSNLPRYYSPSFDYSNANTNFLVLTNYNVTNENITNEILLDDKIQELDYDGNVIWEWACADHFDEFDFSEDDKKYIKNNPIYFTSGLYGTGYDWMHLNSACCLGENKWYDAGDERFNPDNIICSARNRSLIFIVSKETGSIVWKLKGTDLERPFALQHYAHLIPKGLDGEGNLLFFDNGSDDRDYSRILELNPITLEIIFEFTDGFKSNTQGSVQKTADGDYLIGSSIERRIIRVNKYGDVENKFVVWFEFYRMARHPESWFEEYQYTDEEIADIKKLCKEEEKPLTEYELKMYENYIDQLIMYEESLTNQLLLING